MLKGKVAIVTGAAQGIGRGIADIYAQNGATVAICDMQLEKVKQTAKEISEKYHATVMAEKVDVSNKAEVEAFVRQVVENFGKIDILVNNAGILRMHDVIDVTDEEFDLQINVNLKGTFLFMRAVGNLMKT